MNAADLNRLGLEHKDKGQLQEAADCFQKAHQLDPTYTAPLCNIGVLLQRVGQLGKAEGFYRKALDQDPDCAAALANLAAICRDQGRTEEAEEFYRRLVEVRGDEVSRFKQAALLPIIYDSTDHLSDARRRLLYRFTMLARDGIRINPTVQRVDSLFYAAYQGFNDRRLMEDVSLVCSKGRRRLVQIPPPDGRVRVGFVSSHFNNHTIGWMWGGMIAALPRDRLHVTVFSTDDHQDELGSAIRESADSYVVFPSDLKQAQNRISDERCDVLLFTDIGMDARMYAIATSRMSSVQCVTWGHPVTTGLPTVDMFLSSELLEGDGAEQHYTEQLVRLKTMGVYVRRTPTPTAARKRKDFGLPAEAHWYVFAQSMFKLHPEFDRTLAGILRRDPEGILVLADGDQPQWRDRLLARFGRTMPDVLDRVRFMPRLTVPDYLGLTLEADVMLTCPMFGGGKTSYDAFSFGRPVVTMPSPYLRGRITYALYKAMGFMDCVAKDEEDYVRIAVRLGTDAAYRETVRQQLLQASEKIFDDHRAVEEMEDFLFRAGTAER